MLTGDGSWTVLRWHGAPVDPMLEIAADNIDRLTLRDMQFLHGAVRVQGAAENHDRVLLESVARGEA